MSTENIIIIMLCYVISPAPETELNQFEIDSPYKEKSANEFIDIKEDDIIDDQIDKLMGD